jgi:hypothetical protein
MRTLTLTLLVAAILGSSAMADPILTPAQIESCRLDADENAPSGLCEPCHDRYFDKCLSLYQDPNNGPAYAQLAEAKICSRKAAISYSSEKAETADSVANAAFAKCIDLWREYRRLADIMRLRYLASKGVSPGSSPYHMTWDDDRARVVEKLRILVFDVRAASAK